MPAPVDPFPLSLSLSLSFAHLNTHTHHITLTMAQWLEGKKEFFSFRTKIISSLYTRDENLATFMRDKEKLKTGTRLSLSLLFCSLLPLLALLSILWCSSTDRRMFSLLLFSSLTFLPWTVLAMDSVIQYRNFPFLLRPALRLALLQKEELALDAFNAILSVLKRCISFPPLLMLFFLFFSPMLFFCSCLLVLRLRCSCPFSFLFRLSFLLLARAPLTSLSPYSVDQNSKEDKPQSAPGLLRQVHVHQCQGRVSPCLRAAVPALHSLPLCRTRPPSSYVTSPIIVSSPLLYQCFQPCSLISPSLSLSRSPSLYIGV